MTKKHFITDKQSCRGWTHDNRLDKELASQRRGQIGGFLTVIALIVVIAGVAILSGCTGREINTPYYQAHFEQGENGLPKYVSSKIIPINWSYKGKALKGTGRQDSVTYFVPEGTKLK